MNLLSLGFWILAAEAVALVGIAAYCPRVRHSLTLLHAAGLLALVSAYLAAWSAS